MVPKGWIDGRVEHLLAGLESGVSVNGENRQLNPGEKGVLKVSAVSYGTFDPKAIKAIEIHKELARAKTPPKKGQIIISRSNTEELVGASAYIEEDYTDLFLPDKLWQTIPKPNANMKWLSYFLSSEHARYTLSKLATGTSGSMKNITKGELLGLKIGIPPLDEQRKIAKILSTWDKAISTIELLIDNSKQQKKALMQHLLTGKKRLLDDSGKPFEGDWENAKLSEIGKVSIGLVTTMTKYYVDKGTPLIRNSDIKQNKIHKSSMLQLCVDFSSEYESRKLRRGDVVTVHTGEVGVSSVINAELDGCIGFATLNTRPNKSKVTPEFLSWYFNSKPFINWCVAMSTGDGRQNLNLKDFVKATVMLPSLSEQKRIVSVLVNADKEIELLDQQLADLKQEKKALMQQLLTGKRRVMVNDKDVI